MTVIATDKWLEKDYDNPHHLYKKLSSYFNRANPEEVASLLTQHGMYQKPVANSESLLQSYQEKNVWQIVNQEEQTLKRQWNGQNVSIFILPSNTYNRKIMHHYNGKSGLAFKDKLFLFISEDTSETELKALFTHEYNHCCRLKKDPKNEEDYQLLDAIILEGLAENAVHERFGKKYLAPWTSYYSTDVLNDIWKNLIKPNKDLTRTSRKHNQLLYGTNFYPKMAGYSVGYFLVNRYAEKTRKKSKDLFVTPSEEMV
ncbi:DUF2268 domain-containing protein [Ornithinibacillus xuwenensis]|uniref:DUF2268 domain-containing putative Zn-dependent protease n=1 Tax=Ornithinibacillus xuwenensis TaxID=3144668 RepID=A0ABU9XEJ0_9BACI